MRLLWSSTHSSLGSYPSDSDDRNVVEPDHLGSPRAVIDPVTKAVLWRWRPSNDPFGTMLPEEDADGDGIPFVFDLRFPGQRYDSVTGLYYNYFRDYDAASGRYIQVDPIGLAGGINPYLYANGSPWRYTDVAKRRHHRRLRRATYD